MDVEDEDAVVFDEAAQVEQIDQHGGRADEDVGEDGGVDLAEVAGEERVLRVGSEEG